MIEKDVFEKWWVGTYRPSPFDSLDKKQAWFVWQAACASFEKEPAAYVVEAAMAADQLVWYLPERKFYLRAHPLYKRKAS